jgi:outer membrane protein
MTSKYILVTGSLIILVGLCSGLVFFRLDQGKKGYVINQEVFEGFQGKKSLEMNLLQVRRKHKYILDSLANNIGNHGPAALIQEYDRTAQELDLKERQLSERYTADLWKQINEYIKAYGDENNYDFIFGASGNGSLMYATESKNITQDIVSYINKRYEHE